jgi:putative transposase
MNAMPEPMMSRKHLQAVNPLHTPTRHELVAHAAKVDLHCLPPDRLAQVRAKARICAWLLARQESGVSFNNAYALLRIRAEMDKPDERVGALGSMLLEDMRTVACGVKELPSRSTVAGWLSAYRNGGEAALASGHWSRQRKDQGWEALALQIYSAPGKPSMAVVARDLKRKHDIEVTSEQVRRYLTSLPTHLAERSSLRLGEHLFKQIETPYKRRDLSSIKPGEIVMADGWRADVYVAHPVTGSIWRPEIMHVIDLKTQYLFGLRVMANEGSIDVMLGWAESFERHGHVPTYVWTDRGAGYYNKRAGDELTGYLGRSGVQRQIKSLPKNARGKGQIERYHRVVRDDLCKTWRPEFYCGPDMAKDALDRTVREVKAGRLKLPTLQEFMDVYKQWLDDEYHQRPCHGDKSLTRADAWAQLVRIPPHASAAEIARPQERRRVNRATVRAHSREYSHPNLIGWNGRDVLVEFDLLSHATVVVRDLDGHLICDAPLIKTVGIVQDSLLADDRQKAVDAAVRRDERRLAETKARAGLVIDADAVAMGVIDMAPTTPLLQHTSDDDITLDLTEIFNRNDNNQPEEDL